MAITDRKSLYRHVLVDGNKEIDPLDSVIPDMEFSDDRSRSIVISEDLLGRLDLISFYLYDTSDFWWLIAQHNDLLNPMEDMYIGQVLMIPSQIDFYNIYNANAITDDVEKVFSKRELELE